LISSEVGSSQPYDSAANAQQQHVNETCSQYVKQKRSLFCSLELLQQSLHAFDKIPDELHRTRTSETCQKN